MPTRRTEIACVVPKSPVLCPRLRRRSGGDRRGCNEMPWVYQTAYRVEALLAAGVAVGFNSDRHTRVAIACDDTHLLCVDSYGPRH